MRSCGTTCRITFSVNRLCPASASLLEMCAEYCKTPAGTSWSVVLFYSLWARGKKILDVSVSVHPYTRTPPSPPHPASYAGNILVCLSFDCLVIAKRRTSLLGSLPVMMFVLCSDRARRSWRTVVVLQETGVCGDVCCQKVGNTVVCQKKKKNSKRKGSRCVCEFHCEHVSSRCCLAAAVVV